MSAFPKSDGMDSSSPNRHLGAKLVSVINQQTERRSHHEA